MDLSARIHRYPRFFLCSLILAGFIALSLIPEAEASTKRIVLIGDSWTQWPWNMGAFQEVLDGTGTGAAVEGTYTAIGGTAALWWAQNAVPDSGSFPPPPGTSPNPAGWGLLDRLDYTLNNNPTIDIVHMSLGGIDMLAAWRNGFTTEQEEELFTQIEDNVRTVVDHVRARADGERYRFLWVDYDYLNITETCTKYMDEYSDEAALASAVLGFSVGIPLCDNAICIAPALTQNLANNEVINRAFGRCALKKIHLHQTHPAVRYIQNFGNVQYRAGYYDSLGTIWAPAQVPFPGLAPTFDPLPGGNPGYGTPPPLMNVASGKVDPIHLSKTGYKYIFDNCWAQYYVRWIADSVRPSCTGITLLSANPTQPGNVGFEVTFSETVLGVDIDDFALAVDGVENAEITGVSGSGNVYTVTIYTGTAGVAGGLVGLDLVDNDTIYDGADNYLTGSFTTGEVYTIEPVIEGEGGEEGATEGVEEGATEGGEEGVVEGGEEGVVEG
ncbi:MAG TPA: hypothetical protein PLI09_16030, partial [Candidatus Hydrogenedentes bacterium]|nr:hypothetical protein [Candidatus Hydrogenedentota bacterium]